MKTKPNKITLAVFLLTICFALNAQQTVTDIDGNIYNTVIIGTQKWMKENLKTTHYNNGDSIATTYPATYNYMSETTPKYQWAYNGKDSLANIYGRLYTWYAATDNRNVCPTGWHLPSYSEFKTLIDYLGGGTVAHGKLKETGTVHWQSPNADATNESGFTGLPGGSHWDTNFLDMGICGHFWSASQQTPDWSYRLLLDSESFDETSFLNSAGPKAAWSVRCIEDPIPDSAKYFGQTPPGNTAVIFAPGIISLTDRSEAQIAFSPDGKEIYLVAEDGIYIQYKDNTWGPQTTAPVSGDAPFYSLDGKKIYLTIYTWNNNHTQVTSSDIYEVDRNEGTWSQAMLLQAPVNSSSYDGGYCQTADSIIYFHSNRSGNFGIWRINPTTNQAETLGSDVNSTDASAPCVAPDGSYIVFESGREGSFGNDDLYITFKKADNNWTAPLNLNSSGSEINIANHSQIYPSLSPDGKYLFFNRHNWDGLLPDIYWVSTSIIDTLKDIAIPTSIDLLETNNLISVFPNPTTDRLALSFGSTPVLKVITEIYNTDGKLILSDTFLNSITANIDLTGYPTGMYLIKVIAGEKHYEEKIVKE